MEILNKIILELSFWALLIGIFLLLIDLIQKLSRKEKILLGSGIIASLILRIKYGLFAPWHQQDHYIHIFQNLKNNSSGGFFATVDSYYASGGLYEFLYKRIMMFLPDFSVYYVYYISIALNIIAGVLIFILAVNLFKSKVVGFISFFIFAFLPVFIKISATETIFIINVLTILLFINFIFYVIKRKTNIVWFYLILFFIYCSNLLGRKEYLAYFIIGTFASLFYLLIFQKKQRQIILNNSYTLLFILFSIIISTIYSIGYILPNMSVGADIFGLKNNFFNMFIHSFLFYENNYPSYALYLKSFFTPWYFLILLIITPLILIVKKHWLILFINLIFLSFLIPIVNTSMVDMRFVLPFLFFLIPQIAYTLYLVLCSFRLSPKIVLTLSVMIITLSLFQNWQFLNTITSKKIEQELLINHLNQTISSGSLLLTVAEKKYEGSKFEQKNNYRTIQHGLEFPSYLIPENKDIDIMDIYREYDSEIIKKYDNIFYYKSLYSHHEENDRFMVYYKKDEYQNGKSAPEATEIFENSHNLIPIEEMIIKNTSFDVPTVDHFLQGANQSVQAENEIKIGLYKIVGIKAEEPE